MRAQDTTETATAASKQATHTGIEPGTGELLRAVGLRKVFCSGKTQVTALAGADLSVARGEIVAIVGPSGSGKSTLLHLLGALDTPTSGTVYFAGNSLEAISNAELAEFRSRSVGFVWQRHHLLADFTAAENIAMPLLARGVASREALGAAHGWLEEVGLTDRAQHRAGELSGGEQQRVAIARALVNQPLLLLADEPTGDLDEGNADTIFDLMQRLHRSHRLTSILATHNLQLAQRCNRILVLERGLLATGEESLAGRDSSSARTTSGRAKAQEERG